MAGATFNNWTTNHKEKTAMKDNSITRDAKRHLNALIERLLAAHSRFKQAGPDERAGTYAELWLILRSRDQ